MSDQAPLFRVSGGELAAERAALLATLDEHAAELDAVDAVLERIDAGTYARCRRCGGLIDGDRLAADVFSPTCGAPACTDPEPEPESDPELEPDPDPELA